jgi:hypothetical protein
MQSIARKHDAVTGLKKEFAIWKQDQCGSGETINKLDSRVLVKERLTGGCLTTPLDSSRLNYRSTKA